MTWLRTERGGIAAVVVLSLLALSNASAGEMRWRVGPVYRTGMETEVSGGTHVQSMGLTAAREGKVYDTQIGDEDSYADRIYEDGYVFRDPGTGNKDSLDPNTTWYWGYDNASQYSASSGMLYFHSSGRETSVDVIGESATDDDSFYGWGVEAAGDLPLLVWNGMDVSLTAGLRGFWGMESDIEDAAIREQVTVREFTVVDGYNVGHTAIPSAPYSGTYDGPFDDPPVIPSPLIPNKPQSRVEKTTSTRTYDVVSHVDVETDADLYEIRLGPTLSCGFGDGRLRASVSPAMTFNVLDLQATREEQWVEETAAGTTQTRQSWSDEASETDFLLGAALSVAAELALNAQWAMALSASADWVDSTSVDVGPGQVDVDVSGYSVGLSLVRTFGAPAATR